MRSLLFLSLVGVTLLVQLHHSGENNCIGIDEHHLFCARVERLKCGNIIKEESGERDRVLKVCVCVCVCVCWERGRG